jgi:hypothetical protein
MPALSKCIQEIVTVSCVMLGTMIGLSIFSVSADTIWAARYGAAVYGFDGNIVYTVKTCEAGQECADIIANKCKSKGVERYDITKTGVWFTCNKKN